MATAVLDAEWPREDDGNDTLVSGPEFEARYAEIATAVRLLQEYELAFWDAVHAAR